MTGAQPTLIVFSGGMRETPVERLVGDARDAAALDTLDRGLQSGAFAGGLLVTDNERLRALAPAGVEVVRADSAFNFGDQLRALIHERRIERPLYVGGGSIPLLQSADLAALARRLTAADRLVISNNYFSADCAGWVPGSALDGLAEIPSDNRLPQLLHLQAGLPSETMERTIASQLDIDTPTDLAVLSLFGSSGRLRGYLDTLTIDTARYRQAMPLFLQPATILVAGRVGSAVWQYLERETACRVRLYSEERGMQADGRERSGNVRSILGFYLERAGPDELFQTLAQLGDAVFLDSRVICAHARVFPSRPDRFLSDLGRWHEVQDPFLRELTRAAIQAPVPVVLGGHSLVSGGLMALVQAAWDAHDHEHGRAHRPSSA